MNFPYLELALLVALTALNAFLTGSEIAFVSLREGQLQRLEEQSKGKRVVKLARNPNRFFATVQIGITLAQFSASASAAVSMAQPMQHALRFLGSAARPTSLVLVTVVLAYFTLVFGELAPKRVGMQRSEQWAVMAARPLIVLGQLARPLIWLLDRSTNLVVRLTGSDPDKQREEITEEELRDLLAVQRGFSPEQRSIITGAFEIAERTLREVVVPRGSVMAVASGDPVDVALRSLVTAGHSRAPVHTGDLDDVLGIVHVRDLIEATGLVRDHTRPAAVLPESLGVLDALQQLQTRRQQMAIVVNEHGGVEGIITIEDLLEEIVGEIYDEFDREINEVTHNDDGSLRLPGSFPIHDLPDLDIELPDGEGAYATVAGYVLAQLGHIPQPGEIVRGEEWHVEVLEVEDRAITSVRFIPQRPENREIRDTEAD